jgi:hypothetical protein
MRLTRCFFTTYCSRLIPVAAVICHDFRHLQLLLVSADLT